MDALVQLLGVDHTFFVQFGIFVFLFVTLPVVFFRPFQRLIELRIARTVEDKAKAAALIAEADQKYEEYRTKLTAERVRSRADIEKALAQVKAQEASILNEARGEGKKITQATLDTLQQQSAQLKRSLEADVEGMALQITDLLLKRQS